MKIIKIPKKNGKDFRTIYVQNPGWERKKYRSYARILEDIFFTKNNNQVVHGFVPGRNCVTNAQEHIGKKYTLTIDLKSFFDYVTPKSLINAGINTSLAMGVMYKNRARQGLSSSPMAANIAASLIDDDILNYIKNSGHNNDCVYTRYADDMIISSDYISFLKKLRDDIPSIVKKHKFKVNHKKTRIQSANYGKRIITGIAVDDKESSPTRANKRKLRALKFKYEKEIDPRKKEYFRKMMVGLEEFTKCKLPSNEQPERKMKLQLWSNHLALASDRILEPSFLDRRYFKVLDRRRILIDKLGIEKVINKLPSKVIDSYGNYELIEVWINKDGPINRINERFNRMRIRRRYLKMKNPSLEGVYHIEGVHPDCNTVQEAINFRRYGDLNTNHLPWLPIILT